MAVDEFGIDEGDDTLTTSNEKFTAEKRKYRVSIAAWPGLEEGNLDMDADSPRFKKGTRVYVKGVGSILCKGPEYAKLSPDQPKEMGATVIVIWPTDNDGTLLKERLKDPKAIRVAPWVFAKDKYRDIKTIHKEWGLGGHDVTIDCTETQFQRMSFSSCRESLLRKFMEGKGTQETFAAIIERIQAAWASVDDLIGRDMTMDQIREKLGSTGSTPAAASAVEEEDIDDMIGDLIS